MVPQVFVRLLRSILLQILIIIFLKLLVCGLLFYSLHNFQNYLTYFFLTIYSVLWLSLLESFTSLQASERCSFPCQTRSLHQKFFPFTLLFEVTLFTYREDKEFQVALPSIFFIETPFLGDCQSNIKSASFVHKTGLSTGVHQPKDC